MVAAMRGAQQRCNVGEERNSRCGAPRTVGIYLGFARQDFAKLLLRARKENCWVEVEQRSWTDVDASVC